MDEKAPLVLIELKAHPLMRVFTGGNNKESNASFSNAWICLLSLCFVAFPLYYKLMNMEKYAEERFT